MISIQASRCCTGAGHLSIAFARPARNPSFSGALASQSRPQLRHLALQGLAPGTLFPGPLLRRNALSGLLLPSLFSRSSLSGLLLQPLLGRQACLLLLFI